jgi:hypothetical protein
MLRLYLAQGWTGQVRPGIGHAAVLTEDRVSFGSAVSTSIKFKDSVRTAQ